MRRKPITNKLRKLFEWIGRTAQKKLEQRKP